jgi:hypothetical protein
MDTGLRLGGEQIHRISGPSSYCLLLPPLESTLPIQLLFGDVHRSFENPCDEDEKHTYKIHEEFLTLLDKVAKVFPIHFYTESAYGPFLEKISIVEDGYLFSRVVRRMKECYGEKTSYSYEEDCPTTYIQFEHVDARYFENSVEGYVFQYLRDFLRKQISHPNPVKGWLAEFEQKLSFTRNIEVWPSGLILSSFIIQLIVGYVESCPRVKEDEELSVESRTRLKILFRRLQYPYNTTKRRVTLRNKILDIQREESGINDHYRSLVYEIMHCYFNSIKGKNSSTERQINKLQVKRGSNVSELKEQLKRIPNLDELKPALHKLFSVDVSVLKNIQKLLSIPPRTRGEEYYANIHIGDITELQQGCEALLFFLDNLFCYLLDIYYIVRMLQTKNSYLSVGYFGDAHTQSITNYLITHLNYRLVVKSEELDEFVSAEDVSRCITLDDIDLDRLLAQHLTLDRKQRVIRHIKQLNKEQQARNDSLSRVEFIQKYFSLKDHLPIWPEETD